MGRIYTREILQEAVDNSISYAGVLRHLGRKQAGGTQCHIKNMIVNRFEIDVSHFTGQGHLKGGHSSNRQSSKEILVLREQGRNKDHSIRLRRALLEEGVEHICVKCGCGDEWNGKKLVLQVDHINGNNLDNRIGNLRFLCPNCHSQTSTFGRRSKKWYYSGLLQVRQLGSEPSDGGSVTYTRSQFISGCSKWDR